MSKRLTFKAAAAIGLLALGTLSGVTAQAQQKLKWAHVYETSEPFHKWSVWAGDEIKKRQAAIAAADPADRNQETHQRQV